MERNGVNSRLIKLNLHTHQPQIPEPDAPTLPLPHSLLPNPNFPNVDVIIPCYNASSTIEAALSSAYYQNYEGLISIVTYDDNSVDETEKRVLEFRSSHPSTPSRKLIHKSAPPDKRDPGGAGYARNRCVEAGSGEVLVLLDSDDVMMPARVKEQVELLMSLKDDERSRAIVGSKFYRDPANSTHHYTNWANGLSPDRLYLEQYRELTLLHPTWCMMRSRFEYLGGYVQADGGSLVLKTTDISPPKVTTTKPPPFPLILPSEPASSLILAEDLRLFYSHMKCSGLLYQAPSVLLMYRHALNSSQSSRTPRDLLVKLRLQAFSDRVLSKPPFSSGFCVWGAGRDGKAFVKSLSPPLLSLVRLMVDVDEKKIKGGYYFNRALDCKIPIKHFTALNSPPHSDLPVVCCVAMYRTGGKLEENVASVSREEGVSLWHFF
ncbi:hypothetical protein TrCOL_g11384 [Triparma columacea]|uniref:Glycosyltransferase 2-like domain-containing protein n=1 Tax=Triparma columacea TaxID=722753 RepID=A0A9W7FXJ7_9STRA|nr:hypothetical protein TrCOL_g11384 [Triparma columacea]